jgi:hypothetical protein
MALGPQNRGAMAASRSLRLKRVKRFPDVLPFPCFCQPVFHFCLPAFHFLFGKHSPLMAHDFQRYKLTVRIH